MGNLLKSAVLIISVHSALAIVVVCQAMPEWRRLAPLISTSDEVENVLGKPIAGTNIRTYSAGDAKFVATYQLDSCEGNGNDPGWKWKVKPGTLIYLAYLPKIRRPPEWYEPNLSSFKRTPLKSGYQYTSQNRSVYILSGSLPEGETVVQISLAPSKDQQILKCRPDITR